MEETERFGMDLFPIGHEEDEESLRATGESTVGEAFFRKLWIREGKRELVVDLETLEVTGDDFEVRDTNERDAYEGYLTEESTNKEIVMRDMNIVVSKYANPQVRTGFSIRPRKKIVGARGALSKPMHRENIEVSSLYDARATSEMMEACPQKYMREKYTNNGETTYTILPIY